MLQIISLIYKYFGATDEYENLFNAIKDYLLTKSEDMNQQAAISFKDLIMNFV
jgi:hypothetical protein